jgi:hypothetical protein
LEVLGALESGGIYLLRMSQAIRPIVHAIFERLRRLQTHTRGSRTWTRETGSGRRRNFRKRTKNNDPSASWFFWGVRSNRGGILLSFVRSRCSCGLSDESPAVPVTNQIVWDTYTLHKPTRRRFPRRQVVVYGIDHQWHADLVDTIFWVPFFHIASWTSLLG